MAAAGVFVFFGKVNRLRSKAKLLYVLVDLEVAKIVDIFPNQVSTLSCERGKGGTLT